MSDPSIASMLLALAVAIPAAGLLSLGVARWARGHRAGESTVARVVSTSFGLSTVLIALLWVQLVRSGASAVVANLGAWFSVGHYAFPFVLVGDRLSLPFATFTSGLVWVIGAFSRRYLHREDGFHRFHLMLSFFGVGVLLVAFAGTLDLVFFGWEIVGLTSALLIAFFHERKAPVENGLRAFATYRFCDVGLLAAAVWLHREVGDSRLVESASAVPWQTLPVPADQGSALLVALLLLQASIGKGAQVPLGGWLPRAMEGPTPSSAIFYGAVSIHLAPYLLLRSADLFATSPTARVLVASVGALTALHATFVGRVQSDIKSVLAYASMTQVGLILIEIGLGWHSLALLHIVGHASLRSLQILRSPSLLHDHHHLEQAMAAVLPRPGGHLERIVPRGLQPWLYRLALERGYFDEWLVDWIVAPLITAARRLDALDRSWTRWLEGKPEPGGARALPVGREVAP